jgi:membrane protease YdiL (CAAX protease family)
VTGRRPDRRHDEWPRRRKVLAGVFLAGSALLRGSLSSKPGSTRFHALSLGAAGLWSVGGLCSGPPYLARQAASQRRSVVAPITTGVVAFGAFYGGAQIAKRIPALNGAITSVMRYTHEGSGPLVLATALANAIGEEMFFRGALFDAVDDRHTVSISTGAYSLAAITTGKPALVLASGVMGTIFARQRRATGGILAPTLTHLTWSALMLRFVAPLFRRGSE